MGKPLTIVFLIDALGWETADRFGFCRDLLDRRAPLDTVLGYSSAAIPTLLSGTTPAEHGAWAMWRRAAPGRSPFRYLRFVPRLPHPLEWRVRHLVRRITDRRRLIRGYYDLYEIPVHLLAHFDVSAHQDPYQPGGLSRETVFDRWAADGVPYRLWYYKTPEADNARELLEAVRGDDEALFLYTAELDALMHRVGIFDDTVEKRLRGYERFIRSVIERAGKEGRDATVHVISDHGMTDVHDAFDVWGALDRAGLGLGRDYLAFFDSTMARLWCDERVIPAAAEIVTEAGAGKLIGDAELAERGCLFEDRSYGDAVLLANPGVMFVPSFMGRSRIAAMHGYDPDDVFSKGCFMTSDPTGELPASILDFKRYLLERSSGRGA
jgi:predicted AlkP superfamily pyrophosphatase or phosphodiesterase